MSFTEAPVASAPAESATAPVTTGPADTPSVGSVDAVGTSVDAATSAQEPASTPTPDADGLYEVKVPGGGVEKVTLDELRNGWMRQSDYTRKTQSVAEQAKDLQQAAALMASFDRDPHATLAALADAYNWTPQQTAAAGQAMAQGQDPTSLEEADPLEQRLASAEQFIASQQRQTMSERIEADFSQLETEFGEIDRDALIAHTLKGGHPNLIAGYRDMTFEVQRQNAAALQAKREAQVVEGAGTVQPNAVSAPPTQSGSLRDTIRAAIRAASQ